MTVSQTTSLNSQDIHYLASENSVKLSILLPVRNEGANIPVTVKMLNLFVSCSQEIIIIYDFPEDNSVPVVNNLIKQYPNITLLQNTQGAGVLNAVRTGIRESHGKYILIYPADEILPIFAINDMILLLDEGCDFINCTRYSYGGKRLGGNLISGIISRLGNKTFTFLAGSDLSDATTGIKMFRKSVFPLFSFEFAPIGWAFAFEMSVKAQLLDLKLGEVPLTSIDRLIGGVSTQNFKKWFIQYFRLYMWGILKLRFRNRSNDVYKIIRRPYPKNNMEK
ncbi:glycosyltransferase [Methanoregula formicica]|uniref:Glycosyl transferase n=1 Tax=Methanoregula formicica (strain DSM 22288 / NBRC 105244 / SMSP) TaxID=593750 RepID=L0H9T4_METFS|nr:glycosyltransferase [Methanoregula formicica]AGB01512.1 glycosyl transferase [Methanoregula formicica SMSP]